MPLKVVLRPGEKLVVNGAVLGAGDRTATLFLHNQAQFLRGRDMLTPESASCPGRAFYLAIQTLYLAQDEDTEPLLARVHEAAQAAAVAGNQEVVAECLLLVEQGACYQALRRCARLFAPVAEAPPPA
jgi:flagellar protein FlbT